MKLRYAEQWDCGCVIIELGDAFEDVKEECYQRGAAIQNPESEIIEDAFCVQFPSRGFPELYTENALRRSMEK